MTKGEVKEWLDKLGVKAEEVTDDLIAKVEAQKALLDAETRRKVRAVWIVFTVAGVALGGLAGWFLRGLVG